MKFLFASVAAILVTACAADSNSTNQAPPVSPPPQSFEGTIEFNFSTESYRTVNGTDDSDYKSPHTIPNFSIQVIQESHRLIVAQPQYIHTDHGDWDVVVNHGYAENDVFEFPFALVERNQNCTHHGLIQIDNAAANAEIAQETCGYLQFNLQASGTANLVNQAIPERSEYLQSFAAQNKANLPTASISELPTTIQNALSRLDDKTVYGLLYDGIHFRSECSTRQGNAKYCEDTILPSYSLAKGLVAGLSTLRFQALYGESFANTNVSELISYCTPEKWQDVSVSHLASMTTGRYFSSEYMSDEEGMNTIEDFFLPASHADKAAFSCGYPIQESPGLTFVYHTSDTYLLSSALQQYYHNQTGNPESYYSEVLLEDIYRPLGLSSLTELFVSSLDEPHIPYAGFGHFYNTNDLVKLAQFIWLDQGEINGQQVIDATTAQAPAGSKVFENGFWFYTDETYEYCDKELTIPYLSGYGGNIIAALPNGMILYFIGDDFEFTFADIARRLLGETPCNS
ncbi:MULTISPECIES: serine hydrolase [Gammaproteobacteria]|uniref:serine hydrolase n=1 Tax=Gammaproteobacteria TaxID=1236 RepID=UPI00140299F6|nr:MULTISPECIES: serine hydrolase [Gammaproteobacteria]